LKLALKRRPVSSAEELPDPKEIREFDSPDLRSKFPVTITREFGEKTYLSLVGAGDVGEGHRRIDRGRMPGMGARLNVPDRATFFGGGGAGYTDYPFLTAAERGAP